MTVLRDLLIVVGIIVSLVLLLAVLDTAARLERGAMERRMQVHQILEPSQ